MTLEGEAYRDRVAPQKINQGGLVGFFAAVNSGDLEMVPIYLFRGRRPSGLLIVPWALKSRESNPPSPLSCLRMQIVP